MAALSRRRDRDELVPAHLGLLVRLLCRCGTPLADGTQGGNLADVHIDALRVPERDTEVPHTLRVARAVPSAHHAAAKC